MLERIEFACAPETALNLVRYPQHTILVAKLAQALPIGSVGLDDAASALYGLKDDDADFGIDRGLTVRAKRRQRCCISNWLATSQI